MQVICAETICKGRIHGAGILCYSIPTKSKEIFFLLGKDKIIFRSEGSNNNNNNNIITSGGGASSAPFYSQQKQKICYNSNRWSDLGGGAQETDTCVEHTAAREFLEESLGIVQLGTDNAEIINIATLTDSLKEGNFDHKIIICVNFGAGLTEKRHYVVFLKQIPWDPSIPARFEIRAQHFAALDIFAQEIIAFRTKLGALTIKKFLSVGDFVDFRLEKYKVLFLQSVEIVENLTIGTEKNCDFGWFVNVILEAIKNKDGKDHATVGESATICTKLGPFECHSDLEKLKLYASMVEIINQQWNYYYINMSPELQRHPCVLHNNDGYLTIDQAFLEKKQLQLWSMDRLLEVLEFGGVYKKEYFRPSFLPLIVALKTWFNSSNNNNNSNISSSTSM